MNYNDLELAVKSVWSLLPSEKINGCKKAHR